ncbi:S-methyl-5-thioribose kinase [Aneurinibacillus thermoaerophilus]|uniref:S-methyl-5-thioribose kinase n=1 Tax=Aneurinibacillus thermoaerophilus TaxID=143495 RepID=UPI002E2347F9|nr:S-methyl-5-thioribose kinase [Aneurinibacillus thermoaerophilus]MED0679257.1 S-methyl-5-thioribose kinase [Aneurinibacillus thermoaerophilus]MED0764804.1 S-methyl-5-thioribose kinase [Aneurinibacillus thermoaerophilus]
MSGYRTLTEQEAVEYARNIPNLFPEDARLVSREIGDGNLNYVFHIKDERPSGKSVIFKQALPYVRVIGDSWPLTLERARIESEALILENQLCPSSVPKVYHHDTELALIVMEDLSVYQIMRKGLVEKKRYPNFPKQIGTFLARTLFLTSDLAMSPLEKKQKAASFTNPELCNITENFVFTYPFHDHPSNAYNPLIANVVQRIWNNNELKLEIAKLKEGFMTRGQALLHGDLHTGSIMVTEEDTKVIDPEFAYYGPMGFDIGAVIANLLLNYAAHEGHTPDLQERESYQTYLLETIMEIWNVFENEFRALWNEKAQEPYAKVPGYQDSYLQNILQDTAGYAGCKMMRRVIGLAHVSDLESITDPKLRAKGETLALTIGQELVLQRKTMTSIKDIVNVVVAATQN